MNGLSPEVASGSPFLRSIHYTENAEQASRPDRPFGLAQTEFRLTFGRRASFS
jgi:hypothetical protein